MQKKTKQPLYNDGRSEVFEYVKGKDEWGNEISQLMALNFAFWFEELGITDKLKLTASSANVTITKKLRTSEYKLLESEQVCLIDGKYFQIVNIYSFTNNEGFRQMDVTLKDWIRR